MSSCQTSQLKILNCWAYFLGMQDMVVKSRAECNDRTETQEEALHPFNIREKLEETITYCLLMLRCAVSDQELPIIYHEGKHAHLGYQSGGCSSMPSMWHVQPKVCHHLRYLQCRSWSSRIIASLDPPIFILDWDCPPSASLKAMQHFLLYAPC
jgi:hypothetical protein